MTIALFPDARAARTSRAGLQERTKVPRFHRLPMLSFF